jgi:hypothetical protein
MYPFIVPIFDFSSLLMGPDLTLLQRGGQQADRLSCTVSSGLCLCLAPSLPHAIFDSFGGEYALSVRVVNDSALLHL